MPIDCLGQPQHRHTHRAPRSPPADGSLEQSDRGTLLPGSQLPNRVRPIIRPYQTLSQHSIDGNWFRAEAQTQDVTGHREFDVQFPDHHLTLTPYTPPTSIAARMDGCPLERFALRPGQLTLLPAEQRARGYADGVGTRGEVRLSFKPDLVIHACEIEPSRLGLVRSMDLRNPSILHAMAALGREVEQPGPMGRAYAESLVVLAVTELVRYHSTLTASPKSAEDLPSRRLRRMIDYIEAHLSEDLSLLTLAAEAGMSPARFARGFRQAMGHSVHQYLLKRRLEWAAALLGGAEQPIAEVALATGFCSQSHLTTAFQHLYHTTPAAYRRERR
jgi:AraC family transcriptional regulator